LDRATDTVDIVLHPAPQLSSIPESGSDWFAAAHRVEPLVRLACDGIPRPGLAISWERLAGGRVWTFELRGNARLPDGAPVSAEAIARDWRRPAARARLALAEVSEVTPENSHSLRVTFAAPVDSAPARLADPVLAPGLEDRRDGWDHRGPYLRIVPAPPDLRDAVDAGTGMIVTADPATLAYARTRADRVALPLPWGRTYVLASPRPFAAARDERFRGSLARDVVREEARPAAPLVWWDPGCAPAPARATAVGDIQARVAFPSGDPVAAAIAGRLVALGAAGPRGTVQAMLLSELLERLGQGEPVSAVVPVSRLDPAPCAVRSLALAGWFVAPLVDTRAHLIARREGPAVEADGFGALRLLSPDTTGR
jgi:hypothetical protein